MSQLSRMSPRENSRPIPLCLWPPQEWPGCRLTP